MSQYKYSGGAVLAVISGIALLVVLITRWLGQNATQISAGVRVAGQVFAVLVVCGLIGGAVMAMQKRRRADASYAGPQEDAPPPVHAVAEQVPVAAGRPLELTAGPQQHLYFPGLTRPEDVAEAIRLAAIPGGDDGARLPAAYLWRDHRTRCGPSAIRGGLLACGNATAEDPPGGGPELAESWRDELMGEIAVLRVPGAGLEAVPRQVVTRRRSREVTVRDARVLTWIGEQYGVRSDVLAVLLRRYGDSPGDRPVSETVWRWHAARWEDMGFTRKLHVLGGTWLMLTPKGLDLAGVKASGTWRFPAPKLAHCHAVNIARLHWETRERAATAAWVSERRLFAERADLDWHMPDAVVEDPDWGVEAIEVELTLKPVVRYQEEVFRKLRCGPHAPRFIRYLVPDERFAERLSPRLAQAAAGASAEVLWDVQVLPDVEGVRYMQRWRP